jgi:hypothetical protein
LTIKSAQLNYPPSGYPYPPAPAFYNPWTASGGGGQQSIAELLGGNDSK